MHLAGADLPPGLPPAITDREISQNRRLPHDESQHICADFKGLTVGAPCECGTLQSGGDGKWPALGVPFIDGVGKIGFVL